MAQRRWAESLRPLLRRAPSRPFLLLVAVSLIGSAAQPAVLAAETTTTLPPGSGVLPRSTGDPQSRGAPPLAPAGADEAGRLRAAAELRQAELQRRSAAALANRAARDLKPAAQRLTQAQARLS